MKMRIDTMVFIQRKPQSNCSIHTVWEPTLFVRIGHELILIETIDSFLPECNCTAIKLILKLHTDKQEQTSILKLYKLQSLGVMHTFCQFI